MTIVYPKDYKGESLEEVKGNELVIDETKKAEMTAKVKELLGNEPKESKVLMDELEQYYVFEKNQHYTSKQLAEVVEAVRVENLPEIKEEEIKP